MLKRTIKEAVESNSTIDHLYKEIYSSRTPRTEDYFKATCPIPNLPIQIVNITDNIVTIYDQSAGGNIDYKIADLPLVKVKLDPSELICTQNTLNSAKYSIFADKEAEKGDKPILILKLDGKTYLLDGHHRYVGRMIKGAESFISARVLSL